MKVGHESCSEVSAPKWTPGPWRVEALPDSHFAKILATSRAGKLLRVAEAMDCDAHLIAAAPALYEALERLPNIGCQRRGHRHGQTCREEEPKDAVAWCWACHVGRAREALALARGEEVDRGK